MSRVRVPRTPTPGAPVSQETTREETVRRLRIAAVLLVLGSAGAIAAAADGKGGSPGYAGTSGLARGAFRYVAVPSGGRTLLQVIRRRGGEVVRFRSLPGVWGIPLAANDGSSDALSRDGSTLVLATGGRGFSKFVALGTDTFTSRQTVKLDAAFSYDALSPDGQTLFLIQHASPDRYYVRAYDFAQRRLLPQIIFDRREESKLMSGLPMTRVAGKGGRWVYTLYVRQRGATFVHALDTVARRAVCVDLPMRVRRWTLKLNLAGRTVVVRARGKSAPVARIDTRSFRVSA